MKIIDPYSRAALVEILSGNIEPSLLQKHGDALLYKGIVIGKLAIMIEGIVFNHTDVIKGVGKVEDVIRAAWFYAEKIFHSKHI